MNISLPKENETPNSEITSVENPESIPTEKAEQDNKTLEEIASLEKQEVLHSSAEAKITLDITKGEIGEVMKRVAKKNPNLVAKANQIPEVKRLPFGMFELDYATRGGIPFNRITTFWGMESSGKTTHTYLLIRMAQYLHPNTIQVYIDVESTFDPQWAMQLGIDLDRLLVIKPEYGEQAVELAEAFIKTMEVSLLIIDSLPAILPTRELERDAETAEVGGNALLIRRMTTKIVAFLSQEQQRGHEIAVVYINQVRLKIGQLHGNPETMPCGQAPKFYASLVIKFYAKDVIDKTVNPDKATYRDTIATISKSKILINSKKTEYRLAMIETDFQQVGETDSFNSVNGYLKAFGLVEKEKDGYHLYENGRDNDPVVYNKLSDIKELYQMDKLFATKLHDLIAGFDNVKVQYVE